MDENKIVELAEKARQHYDKIIRYYQLFPNLKEAIYVAGKALEPKIPVEDHIRNVKDKDTRLAHHQHRVGRVICKKGADQLLKLHLKALENATTFVQLMEVTDHVAIETPRLGPLWSYDTAQKIGFYKGIYPNEVYLHAGALQGAKLISDKPKGHRKWPRTVSVNHFPSPLNQYDPYIIENMLCVGKREGTFISE